MTHPARGASLIDSLSLLTSAATTYAECAWVVWRQFITTFAVCGGQRSADHPLRTCTSSTRARPRRWRPARRTIHARR